MNSSGLEVERAEIKTAVQYIQWLWEIKYLEKDVTVLIIQSLARHNGFTFSKEDIRSALENAEFVARSGKLPNRVPLYRQTYPYGQKSTKIPSNPNIEIFDSLNIHLQIKKVSSKLFYDGHYQEAIFAAFKKVNNMVKKKSELSTKDGKDLMLTSFTPNNPLLKINKLKTISEKDEQEGFMHIFAGAMQGIRNPRGHDDKIYDEPKKAIEYICLASLLAKIVDKSSK